MFFESCFVSLTSKLHYLKGPYCLHGNYFGFLVPLSEAKVSSKPSDWLDIDRQFGVISACRLVSTHCKPQYHED